MNFRRTLLVYVCSLLLVSACWAQGHAGGAQTVLVLPFNNDSKAPGLDWVSEAFPELLGQRMASPANYVISRDERLLAFDRFGIPQTLHPSLATLYQMAEQMDADYVVIGHYNFDGNTFTASAQTLDMKSLKLAPAVSSRGPLTTLIDIQSALAWELLGENGDAAARCKGRVHQGLNGYSSRRLRELHSWHRGRNPRGEDQPLARGHPPESELHTSDAAARQSLYRKPRYEQAVNWLSRIPKTDPLSNEANFELGIAAFYRGDYERADAAFNFVLTRLPIPAVYNNLGVSAGRRNRRGEIDDLQKAIAADPSDADYRFNLAVAYARNGDTSAAVRQLREGLKQRPDDAEAKSLLDQLSGAAVANVSHDQSQSGGARLPMERIKRNYDETSYQQVAMEIENVAEQRLATTDPKTHAEYHLERGRDLLNQGFTSQAEKHFREALQYDGSSAPAHAGLADALESSDPTASAREAQASLNLQPSAEAYLVLGRLALAKNDMSAAARNADAALALEPANSAAQALKRSIESKTSEAPAKPEQP